MDKKIAMPKTLFFGLLVFMATACGTTPVFEHYQTIENEAWEVTDTVTATFVITDTIQTYNFFINLRNNNNYNYSNLYVFVDTEFPNGKKLTDTVECVLAYPDGRWIGSGFGNVYDNRIMYKYRKRFPLNGDYQLKITHAMREEVLDGILDVGFRLEKSVK